jgi:hypothetical protein
MGRILVAEFLENRFFREAGGTRSPRPARERGLAEACRWRIERDDHKF